MIIKKALWAPSTEEIQTSNITDFQNFLVKEQFISTPFPDAAAQNLAFEEAARLRDTVKVLKERELQWQ